MIRFAKVRNLAVTVVALSAISLSAEAGPTITNGNFTNCGTSTAGSCVTGFVDSNNGVTATPNTTYGGGVPSEPVYGWSTTSTYTYLVTPGSLTATGSFYTISAPNPGSGTNSFNFAGLSPLGGNFLLEDGNYNLNTGNSTNGGVLTQTVTGLLPNQVYAIGFYQAISEQSGYGGGVSGDWQVSLGGSAAQTSAMMTTNANGYSGWVYVTMNFVATATSAVLSFTGTGSGAPPFLGLDGVSITQVPEPASFALLGIGLVGLGVARRRQSRQGRSPARGPTHFAADRTTLRSAREILSVAWSGRFPSSRRGPAVIVSRAPMPRFG